MRTLAGVAFVFVLLFASFNESKSGGTSGFVTVNGEQVLDGAGESLVLKGFNIAFKDFDGTLGEADIKRVADMGANSLRLVLDYRQLESSPLEYDEAGFSLLDAIVAWCETYKIYLILDMHLAPGIQNPHDFVVHREKSYRFWRETRYQERFYALWATIAKRYAQRKIIAGYDLLNEGAAPDTAQYLKVMNTVARKIRAHDDNHMLIVEEAVLPNRGKRLLTVEDDNVLYSIHFFYPPQFTFYTTTRQRPITRYPGNMVTSGEVIGVTESDRLAGSGGWRRVTLNATPPQGAEILRIILSSDEPGGAVWFDDVVLEADGHTIDLPAPLVANNSFEIDYPGISWERRGSCGRVDDTHARRGRHAVVFSKCAGRGSMLSSPIAVQHGAYTLSTWVKTDAARGDNRLVLSWHKGKTLASINKTTLREKMDYALRFKSWHRVPVYVGEFTAHANPTPDSTNNYLTDILEIMESTGLHWSYWTYYSEYPGIGMFTGNDPYLARPDSLRVIERYMSRPTRTH